MALQASFFSLLYWVMNGNDALPVALGPHDSVEDINLSIERRGSHILYVILQNFNELPNIMYLFRYVYAVAARRRICDLGLQFDRSH